MRAFLSQDVLRLSQLRSTGMGLTRFRCAADTGPIGGDMSHGSLILAATGESAGFLRQGVAGLASARA